MPPPIEKVRKTEMLKTIIFLGYLQDNYLQVWKRNKNCIYKLVVKILVDTIVVDETNLFFSQALIISSVIR